MDIVEIKTLWFKLFMPLLLVHSLNWMVNLTFGINSNQKLYLKMVTQWVYNLSSLGPMVKLSAFTVVLSTTSRVQVVQSNEHMLSSPTIRMPLQVIG